MIWKLDFEDKYFQNIPEQETISKGGYVTDSETM